MIGLGPSVPMPRFREPLNVAAFILACAEPNTVYCALGDGTLRALDLATNAVKWEIPGLLRGYSTLRAACKGNHLVVTPGYSSPDREGSVYCLDRHTGRLRWERRWVPRETSGAERKVHLAVTSEVCVVGLLGVNGLTGWDLVTGAARFSVPEPNLPGDLRDSRLQALQDSHDLFFVWKQLWVPTSRIQNHFLVTARNHRDGSEVWRFPAANDHGLVIQPDAPLAAVSASPNEFTVMDVSTGRSVQKVKSSSGYPLAMYGGCTLATGPEQPGSGKDHHVALFSPQGKRIWRNSYARAASRDQPVAARYYRISGMLIVTWKNQGSVPLGIARLDIGTGNAMWAAVNEAPSTYHHAAGVTDSLLLNLDARIFEFDPSLS